MAMGAPNEWRYENGEMVPDFATDQWLTMLTYIKDMYDSGYMNKDFAEITANDRTSAFDQGKCGVIFCTTDDISTRSANLTQVVPEAVCAVGSALHFEGEEPKCVSTKGFNGLVMSVSYTHLDVYKRQCNNLVYEKNKLRYNVLILF